MRIFDCFTYFRESELLKLRCEELLGLNVTHVLVEAPFTHTGDAKPLYYEEKKSLFGRYNIFGVAQEYMPNTGDAWDNEGWQRDTILECLQHLKANDDDIVIISDLDEIPRWQAVQFYESRMGIASL